MPENSAQVDQQALCGLTDIPDPVWNEILGRATSLCLQKGELLARSGDACKAFLILQEGSVRVRQISPEGREMLLYRLEPGELSVLAITSLMGAGSCPADVVAETDIRALSIPHTDFQYAMTRSPAFRDFVLATLAKRLHDTMLLVESVAFQPLDVRLAATLRKFFQLNDTDTISITHEALAMELGTTREVVSRMLKDFEQQKGCVKLHRGRIELVSPLCLGRCARRGYM
ncbi:MAG: Crp/Fnr family transcriptional regulator [Thiogranum sp.]